MAEEREHMIRLTYKAKAALYDHKKFQETYSETLIRVLKAYDRIKRSDLIE